MMSAEAGPETLAARNRLADLIAEAAGGLSDRDRSVLELAYRHGLDGPELAEALEISPGHANKLVSRLRQTIEHSLGALLVARRAQHDSRSCAALQQILTGRDGRFNLLMRKRISRHIQSCPECELQRRKLVNPIALLGAMPVFIPAPPRLRQRTLNSIQLTAAAADTASGPGHRLTIAYLHRLITRLRATTCPYKSWLRVLALPTRRPLIRSQTWFHRPGVGGSRRRTAVREATP